MLWHFTAEFCHAGDVGKYHNDSIAKHLCWDGDSSVLVSCLIDAGWLDRCECHRLRVHDWPDHADQTVQRVLAKRNQGFIQCYDKTRMKLGSSQHKTSQPSPSPSPSPEPLPVARYPTRPATTEGDIPTLQEAIAQTQLVGIDREFCEYVYNNWCKRSGRDANGVVVGWLPYVTGRWANESNEWRNGMHRGNKRGGNVNGQIPPGIQLKAIDEEIAKHPANPNSTYYNKSAVTDLLRSSFRALCQKRNELNARIANA